MRTVDRPIHEAFRIHNLKRTVLFLSFDLTRGRLLARERLNMSKQVLWNNALKSTCSVFGLIPPVKIQCGTKLIWKDLK